MSISTVFAILYLKRKTLTILVSSTSLRYKPKAQKRFGDKYGGRELTYNFFFSFYFLFIFFCYICFIFSLFYFVHFVFVFILLSFFIFVYFHFLIFLMDLFFHLIFFFISFQFWKSNQMKTTRPRADIAPKTNHDCPRQTYPMRNSSMLD